MPVKRINFATIKDPVEIPNLLEIQKKSYDDFFQHTKLPQKRDMWGLEYILRNTFPIYDFNDDSYVEFIEFTVGYSKFNIDECKVKGLTYAVPLRARFRLVIRERDSEGEEPRVKDMREEELYLGEVPLMTERGSFIINGAERVIVSQLHRSPGLVTKHKEHSSGRILFGASIIPHRGSWLEFLYNIHGELNFSIDRSTRQPKIPVTVLLRAFGIEDNREITKLYFDTDEIASSSKELEGKYLLEEVVLETETGPVTLFNRFDQINETERQLLLDNEVESVTVIGDREGFDITSFINTLQKDEKSGIKTREDALIAIYGELRPGDLSSIETAENAFNNIFDNPRRYDLSRVGRKKINSKLGLDFDYEQRLLTKEDIVETIRLLINIHTKELDPDDVDHLGNRRVRAVGELLEYRFLIGLTRMERVIKERMSILDIDECMPRDLVNAKPLMSAVKEFFGSSQLSQFLDQINPLAELTHKRRLSALGPGGLSRERANFEVRDVHYTHYGRICPIETPEGPNIGLISSLATYARINEFGFVETCYRRVEKGVVTNDIEYLDANDEDKYAIAQANAPINDKGKFIDDEVYIRRKGEFLLVPPKEVDYMDITPRQLVSISTSLIPFLEHDDANRALMGSNMQRQAVPLVYTETPLVATGMEARVAEDSGVTVMARASGIVEKVTADEIVIRPDTAKEDASFGWFEPDVYQLKKYLRTNQDTCFNQIPIVEKGDKVKVGQTIADGPATDGGELALGKNVLAAFMPWMGYNYEDAILISSRLVQDDTFTSIHIEEFEIECRETKLGREEITRDIPNVGSEALKNLGERGIVRIGAEVKSGDIMVGKVVPKGETELTPEEKLLRAIFGEKAGDVRDASLKAPPGMSGIVVDVKVFERKERDTVDARTKADETRRINRLEKERTEKTNSAKEVCEAQLLKLLKGETFDYPLTDELSDEVFIKKGKKVTKRNLSDNFLNAIIDRRVKFRGALSKKTDKVVNRYIDYMQDVSSAIDKSIDLIRKGDDLAPGVLQMVKVYVARKRHLT
ncbi:MAG: DNA-directed RNA polymerase subunit beta, partial [bacterium]|nr:DNA-directed RNA polymerase subunit beta [bacterium]